MPLTSDTGWSMRTGRRWMSPRDWRDTPRARRPDDRPAPPSPGSSRRPGRRRGGGRSDASGPRQRAIHAEVLARIEDLRASRTRIVAAGEADRRRLERDLHDGAQQGLLGLSLAFGFTRAQANEGADSRILVLIDDAEERCGRDRRAPRGRPRYLSGCPVERRTWRGGRRASGARLDPDQSHESAGRSIARLRRVGGVLPHR